MKLRDLDAQFMRWEPRPPTEEERKLNPHFPANYMNDWFIRVEAFAEAHLVKFICPKGHAAGHPHSVYIAFEGSPVPEHLFKNKDGQTVRWKASGSSLDDLTLTPSILEEDNGCEWHGYVTRGEAG